MITVKAKMNGIKKTTIAFILCYVLTFALVSMALTELKPSIRLTSLVIRGLYILPIGGAFAASLWASRKTISYKRLWQLMTIGMFLWFSGEVTYLGYVQVLGTYNVPSPSLADVFLIAYVPVMLGILFSLAQIRPPFDSEKKQFLTNVSMASLAVFLLCYKFMLMPTWYSYPEMASVQRIFTIAYPVLDWIILVSLLFASYRLKGNKIEGWLLLLATAFIFTIFADIAFYLSGNQKNYYTNLALIVTAASIALAAIDEVTGAFMGIRNRQRTKVSDISDAQALTQNPWHTLFIPLITFLVIAMVWISYFLNGSKIEIPVLGVISTAIFLLLIYRNHLQLSDNAILLAKTLRDGLTGLHNHRYFQEALDKAISKADKTKKPVSLFVLDIDNLSEINNQYGHFFGDKVLTTIGAAITSKTREDDEACRLSGDEFGVILPKTGQDRALTIATRIKNHMEKTLAGAFPDKDITVTIGLSTYPTLAKDKDELLHTADGALYWGKLQGKNNVLTYDPQVVEALSAEERTKRVEEAALLDLVKTLVTAVDAKDEYTGLHSNGVSDMAGKLARQIGLDEEAINRVEVAGMLHDVGKIGMPDSILNKPSRLTDDEMAIIKTHPELSAQIINSTSLKDVVPAVRSHHERWDGNGYPNGLKGKQIPLEARILAIADTYDAMITDRPYRKGLPVDDAITEIKRSAGTQLDPELVGHFLALFSYRNTKKRSAAAREKRPEANCKVVANS